MVVSTGTPNFEFVNHCSGYIELTTVKDPIDENSLLTYKAILEAVIETVYPVGTVYTSKKSTDPSTLFGGTWVKLNDTINTTTLHNWYRYA